MVRVPKKETGTLCCRLFEMVAGEMVRTTWATCLSGCSFHAMCDCMQLPVYEGGAREDAHIDACRVCRTAWVVHLHQRYWSVPAEMRCVFSVAREFSVLTEEQRAALCTPESMITMERAAADLVLSMSNSRRSDAAYTLFLRDFAQRSESGCGVALISSSAASMWRDGLDESGRKGYVMRAEEVRRMSRTTYETLPYFMRVAVDHEIKRVREMKVRDGFGRSGRATNAFMVFAQEKHRTTMQNDTSFRASMKRYATEWEGMVDTERAPYQAWAEKLRREGVEFYRAGRKEAQRLRALRRGMIKRSSSLAPTIGHSSPPGQQLVDGVIVPGMGQVLDANAA